MKHPFLMISLWLLATATHPLALPATHWPAHQAQRLIVLLEGASDEGLGTYSGQAQAVQAALRDGNQAALDKAATPAAIALLEAYRHGCCNAQPPRDWHIPDTNHWGDAAQMVAAAVSSNAIDALFNGARASHPYYQAMQLAYARETDPARRNTIAANLDRWRWMPRTPSTRYLLVNTAAFEASLWEGDHVLGRWNVVVGKKRSPTPIFSAQVTGVILNPWWDIPPDIARENIAGLVRNHPGVALAKGYVLTGGRYRQRPGPANALGRMKLVMPNPFGVYLHDTPEQALFSNDVRAFSHGCVRVGDALGLAATLLFSDREEGRARLETSVATGQTQTLALPAPIPVYVAYFTAEPDGLGGIRYLPDIYHRDPVAGSVMTRSGNLRMACTRLHTPSSW